MKLPRRTFLHLAAGAAALPAVSSIARAQAYPTRPVRIIEAKRDRLPKCRLAHATILFVEDEVLVRMTLADQLRSAGYVVLEASNADEALDLLHSKGHGVQLLLSDIRMPGWIDGVELARAIRAQHPEIKIVLASGESFSASHWGDTDGFFPKPYNARRLIEHIKMLLG
jgi:two-component system, response regulator PdtaR